MQSKYSTIARKIKYCHYEIKVGLQYQKDHHLSSPVKPINTINEQRSRHHHHYQRDSFVEMISQWELLLAIQQQQKKQVTDG